MCIISFYLQVVYSHTGKVGTETVKPAAPVAKEDEDDDIDIDAI